MADAVTHRLVEWQLIKRNAEQRPGLTWYDARWRCNDDDEPHWNISRALSSRGQMTAGPAPRAEGRRT